MKLYRLPVSAACALLALALLVPASPVRGADHEDEKSPMEIVKDNSETVLAILRDPKLQGKKHREERHQKVRDAVADKFDWRAMARSSLGRHWRDRSEEERAEFTRLFRKLLEQIYIKRIEEHAANAEVNYVKEKIEEDKAVVFTTATKNGTKAPINYKMSKVEREEDEAEEGEKTWPDWMIYDVEVEGVSLLLNYREQFNEIIIGSGYDVLVRKLKKKVGAD